MGQCISTGRASATGTNHVNEPAPRQEPAEGTSPPGVRAGLPEGTQTALKARQRDADAEPQAGPGTSEAVRGRDSRPPRGAAPGLTEAQVFRGWQAVVASNRMLARPRFSEVVNQFPGDGAIRPTANPPPRMDDKLRVGTQVIDDLSAHNMARLARDLQVEGPGFHTRPGDGKLKLSEREWQFMDAVKNTPLLLTHATNQDIVDADQTLNLSSHRHLASHAMAKLKLDHPDQSAEELMSQLPPQLQRNLDDIEKFGNDGYVFFALEAGEESQKPSSRFGKTMYEVPLKPDTLDPNAIMMLNDPNAPKSSLLKNYGDEYDPRDFMAQVRHSEYWKTSGLNDPGAAEGSQGTAKYPKAQGSYKEMHATSVGDRLFFKADCAREALAMSILVSARKLGHDTIAHDLLNTDPKDINKAINSAFRPQIMVPHKFATVEFKQRQIDPHKIA